MTPPHVQPLYNDDSDSDHNGSGSGSGSGSDVYTDADDSSDDDDVLIANLVHKHGAQHDSDSEWDIWGPSVLVVLE